MSLFESLATSHLLRGETLQVMSIENLFQQAVDFDFP